MVDDFHGNRAELLALRSNDLGETLLVAIGADIHRPGLAGAGFGLILRAIIERDLREAAGTLEDLAIDGIPGCGLAPTAVAARLVEPVDFRLDLFPDLLECESKPIGVDRRAMVLGDERGGGAAIDGDGFATIQQGRQRRAP